MKANKRLTGKTSALAVISTLLMAQSSVAASKSIAPQPKTPKIQLAILLDTSGSMSGLIDQTRNQIWQVVNEFSKARHSNQKTTLEVAVYQYGNNSTRADRGYIEKISDLSTDLDKISESLFSLTTSGGSEYCGYAIDTAVKDLQWSSAENDIRTIFIAGNEPFTQGPVPFNKAIQAAKAKGITVNTIHAGSYAEGEKTGWAQGAKLAGGDYSNIDHNQVAVHIKAPQDKKLAQLNKQLNSTYLPYGEQGTAGAIRQQKQDAASENISSGLLAKRTKSKASHFYDNSSWDLIDAYQRGKVKLMELSKKVLPESMRNLKPAEREAHVKMEIKKRDKIKSQIAVLGQEREQYVAKEKRKLTAGSEKTIDSALIESVKKQATGKNYSFTK